MTFVCLQIKALPGGLGEGSLILIGALQLDDTGAAENCLFLIEQASLVDMRTNSKTIKSLWVFCLLSQATILCEIVLLCVPSQTSLRVSDSLRTESHQKSWISRSNRETELLLGFFPL